MPTRRTFLKIVASLMAPMIDVPIRAFVPPRDPFVHHAIGLDGLYSHVGILPITRELNICEGLLLDIGDWDGTGYPCLVQNACTFGKSPPQVWIYDFDLWNFRHDDHLDPPRNVCHGHRFQSHSAAHAYRRFGKGLRTVVMAGRGPLARQLYGVSYP